MQQAFQQHWGYVPDAATQQRLNEPLSHGQDLKDEHKNFLKKLIEKLEKGELNPLSISTIHNPGVYEKMSETDQERADLTALNLMGIIKQIDMLWRQEHKATFQIQNLVETVWKMKSAFEEKYGDVYII